MSDKKKHVLIIPERSLSLVSIEIEILNRRLNKKKSPTGTGNRISKICKKLFLFFSLLSAILLKEMQHKRNKTAGSDYTWLV